MESYSHYKTMLNKQAMEEILVGLNKNEINVVTVYFP